MQTGIVPEPTGGTATVASTEYALLSTNPYRYTQDELIVEVHLARLGISEDERRARGAEIRAELFGKPHPCMRASPLPKRYGWGVHYDGKGRIAIFGRESPEYRAFMAEEGGAPRVLTAMRGKRG